MAVNAKSAAQYWTGTREEDDDTVTLFSYPCSALHGMGQAKRAIPVPPFVLHGTVRNGHKRTWVPLFRTAQKSTEQGQKKRTTQVPLFHTVQNRDKRTTTQAHCSLVPVPYCDPLFAFRMNRYQLAQMADLLHSSTFLCLGFRYVAYDLCWVPIYQKRHVSTPFDIQYSRNNCNKLESQASALNVSTNLEAYISTQSVRWFASRPIKLRKQSLCIYQQENLRTWVYKELHSLVMRKRWTQCFVGVHDVCISLSPSPFVRKVNNQRLTIRTNPAFCRCQA